MIIASVRRFLLATICGVILGCGVASQPESIKTVAAFEVPLPSNADRDQFLSILRSAADAEGMHVDATSDADLAMEAKASSTFKMTMSAAVWRGSNDDDSVASAMDQFDHLGKVWLMFSRGKDPTVTARFRERVMREILLHWPSTLSLPIMPSGSIPLPRDLIRTPTGYTVSPSEARRYNLNSTETQSR